MSSKLILASSASTRPSCVTTSGLISASEQSFGEVGAEEAPGSAPTPALNWSPDEAEAEGERAGLERLEPERRVAPTRGGSSRDARAATSSISMPPAWLAMTTWVPAGPVERDRQVELRRDRRGLLDEHLQDRDPLGRRLRRPEPHPEDLPGGRLGRRRVVGQLDAAGLAAAARRGPGP